MDSHQSIRTVVTSLISFVGLGGSAGSFDQLRHSRQPREGIYAFMDDFPSQTKCRDKAIFYIQVIALGVHVLWVDC